jgi:DNA-binding NarL/FixJ family response regulator
MTPAKPERSSRAKHHLAWEQVEVQSNGYYSRSLNELAERFPMLTRMELRVSALVKGNLNNWEIAEKLNICEDTVENHRVHIRRKLGLAPKQSLLNYLLRRM